MQRVTKHSAGAVALGAALLLSACTARSTPTPPTARQAPAIPVTAVAVERGDIEQSLAYSGDIRSVGQISVLAKGSGRIERLLVDVGSRVRAGDTIAELERDSASYQVMEARAGLASAEARLAQLQAGGKADDVAGAQAALLQQESRLASMRAGGRAEDVAVAEAALAAQEARLNLMEMGGRSEAVAQAQAALEGTRARLSSVQRGATDDVRQAARSAVDSSRAAVAAAEAALAHTDRSIAADLRAAESAYSAAVAVAAAAQAALDQANNPPAPDIAAAAAAVARAEADLEAARSAQRTQTPQPNQPNDVITPNSPLSNGAAVLAAAQTVAAAKAQLDQLRRGGAAATQAQLRATLEEAQAQVATTRARLEALTASGAEAQRATAQSQLVAAQEKLRSDEARLREVLSGPHEDDITQAESAVRQAEQQLALAVAPATGQEISAQRAMVEEARLQVEKARSPHTSYDIEQQAQAVAQARAALSSRRNPYTSQEIAAARAAVEEAQARLALADLGIRETIVAAPVDGAVGERLVAQGALVSPSTPIVTLVPPGLELVVNVEEAQLGQVSEGQPVTLQVAAFPGKTFGGTVVAIAPIVDVRTRTASVRIVPGDEESQLRPGMLARLSILTASRLGTLLVPRDAILGGAGGSNTTAIVVDENKRARKVPVQVGLTNERHIEVLAGLAEGQLVVARGSADLTDGDALEVQPIPEMRTAQTRY